jgi:hypothetical protein
MLHLFCALNMKFICGSRPQQWGKERSQSHITVSGGYFKNTFKRVSLKSFRSAFEYAQSRSVSARAAFYGEDSPTHPSHPTFLFFFFCLQHRFAVVTRGSGQEAERRAGAKRQEGVGRETSIPPPFSFLAAARFPFATGRPIPVDPFVESSGQ